MSKTVYIIIPAGYTYQAADNETTFDHFKHSVTGEVIDIQGAVKEKLRHLKKTEKYSATAGKVHMYFRSWFLSTDLKGKEETEVLCYTHVNNGKSPGTGEIMPVWKTTKFNLADQTSSQHSSWLNFYFGYNKERLLQKRDEQRDNRRHIGDCPKAT